MPKSDKILPAIYTYSQDQMQGALESVYMYMINVL